MPLINRDRTNLKYILILTISAAIVSFAALFYWWQTKTITINMPEIAMTENHIEKPTSLDTSNWPTYKNEVYNFEFRYPAEWAVKEDGKIEDDNMFYIYEKASCVGDCADPSVQIRFGINNNTNRLPVSEWFEQGVKTASVGNGGIDSSFSVDDSQGIKRIWRANDNRLLAIFTAFPGKNLDKMYYFLTAGQDNSRILDAILRSFHFLNS